MHILCPYIYIYVDMYLYVCIYLYMHICIYVYMWRRMLCCKGAATVESPH